MSMSGRGPGPGSTPTNYELSSRAKAFEQEIKRRQTSGYDTFDPDRDHLRENRRTVFVFLPILAAVVAKFAGYW